MNIEQAIHSMKTSLCWGNWGIDQADAIRTLLLGGERVKILEQENATLRNRLAELSD